VSGALNWVSGGYNGETESSGTAQVAHAGRFGDQQARQSHAG
jgi:hypothetical protein